MPDGSTSHGPYRTPPPSDDERIADPIRRGVPEDIPGLGWNRPNFLSAGHKIVRTFAIGRKQRPGGSFIPCAICSNQHPKFLDGAVLWSPDGWLRVIGHICAASPEHFGEAKYRNLRKQRQQEELDGVSFNWLYHHIEEFRPLITQMGLLKSVALFLEEQQHALFHDVTALANLLFNAAHRDNGMLTVVQKLSGTRRLVAEASTGMAQSLYETIQVGTLQGPSLFSRPRHKRSRQVEGIIEALNLIPVGSGEEAMLALIDGGEQKVTVTAGAVLRAIQRAGEIARDCADAALFIKPENLAVLESWGKDIRNTARFSIERGRTKITIVLEDKSRATLSINWPQMPDFSKLQTIIDTGVQLDGLLSRNSGSNGRR